MNQRARPGLPPRPALLAKVRRRFENALRHHSRRLRERLASSALGSQSVFRDSPARVPRALMSFSDWPSYARHAGRRRRPRFFASSEDRARTVGLLREMDPGLEERTVRAADRVCEHEFDLLGSGPVQFGTRIDWHVDPISGHHWEPNRPAHSILPTAYPGGPDIKWPWELSRCQHFAVLGQAYWFTGRDAYAAEYSRQVLHWLDQNPIHLGVNWVCTMDVALRAVNWLWGYYLLRDSPALDDVTTGRMFCALLEHGRFIARNLENFGSLTSNHYFSNLVGLVYLGSLMSEFPEARTWRAFATVELRKELRGQVHEDGTDFEASSAYHRLVTEMGLSATLLAQRNHVAFEPAHLRRLESMVDVVAWLTRSDGTVPRIGDHDDGRVHRLARWAEADREWADMRYLLAIGAVLFRRPDLADLAGDQWQEAVWLLGPAAVEDAWRARSPAPAPLERRSRSFPDTGWFVLRSRRTELVVTAGPCGQRGNGGHAHSDVGSFVFQAGGMDWIVDPGCYVYTRDYDARFEHRLARSHNRVLVDGREPDVLDRRRPFQLSRPSPPEILGWEESGTTNELRVRSVTSHAGAEDAVVWERRFVLHRDRDELHIEDTVSGNGVHGFEVPFHLAPDVLAARRGDQTWEWTSKHLDGGAVHFSGVSIPEGLELSLIDGWVSESYGRRRRSRVLVGRCRGRPPRTMTWRLRFRARGT